MAKDTGAVAASAPCPDAVPYWPIATCTFTQVFGFKLRN
jgi:hypothetical protein